MFLFWVEEAVVVFYSVVAVPVWLELLPPQVCQALEDMVLLAFF
jgi:hypothetical protein